MSIFHVEDEFFGNQIILGFWDVLEYFLIQIYNSRFIYVFRYPPADACQKLKDVLNVVDFFDDEPDIDEADELREILTHYHMKTLLQVFNFLK